MGKSAPAPPATPDYAQANREAIQADIDTLPERRRIEAEARLGQGQFTGLGDADLAAQMFQQQLEQAPEAAEGLLNLQKQYGGQFIEESRKQAQQYDPNGFALREGFTAALGNGSRSTESLYNDIGAAPSYEQVDGDGPALERLANAEKIGSGPAFERMIAAKYGEAGLTGDTRGKLEQQLNDELSRAGSLDPALQRAAEQAARARGAATGNLYGGGNAIQEALSVQLAQRDQDNERRGNALAFLQSGQSASDTQNRLAEANMNSANAAAAGNNNASQQEYQNAAGAIQQNFQNQGAAIGQRNQAVQSSFENAMAAIGQRNQAAQNSFASRLQAAQVKAGARQQDTANIQSALGLAPVAQIAGLNSNAQGGAAPFAQPQYNGTNINGNAGQAGAEWAGQLFGAQTQINAAQQQKASAGNAAGIGAGGAVAAALIAL